MPVYYSYIENGGVLLVGTGAVFAEDILQVNRSIYANSELIRKLRYQICDYTAVDSWQITADEVREIAAQDREAAEVNPTMLIAVVAKKDLAYGLSRMWEAYADNSTLELRIFRTIEECNEGIKSQLDLSEL